MDTIKTFNISTAASIVAAADGINMAKHGARAITSKCGAVDILETLGVDVECDVGLVKKSIEKAGIGIFNGMSGKVHPMCPLQDSISDKVRDYPQHRRVPGQSGSAQLWSPGSLLKRNGAADCHGYERDRLP